MTRYKASGHFENGAMERQTIENWPDGLEMVHLWFPTRYTGDIDGHGTIHVLYARRQDGVETLCAIERVEGTLGGRRGTFVDQQEATPDGSKWSGPWRLIEGMGTGDLTGLRGGGRMEIPYSTPVGSWTLEYWFE